MVNDGRKSFGWLPFSKFKRMVLKINKSDYERMVCALEVARDSETNANKKRLYNLTRKKLNRQNEVFLKKNKDLIRSI